MLCLFSFNPKIPFNLKSYSLLTIIKFIFFFYVIDCRVPKDSTNPYDKKSHIHQLTVDDKVILNNPILNSKLASKWLDNYEIIEMNNLVNCILKKGTPRKVHVNRITKLCS